jgi:uracil-DNA glycosylase family 4
MEGAFGPGELRRQAEAALRSLQQAGIGWLPRGPALEIRARPAEPEPTAPPAAEDPMARMTLAARRKALEVLAERVSTCPRCKELAATRTQTVFGDGNPGAELCFIGEAPGADEDWQGIPFVGAAGQLLNRIIAACGMRREDVYICNIVKCRPPGNRTPLPHEAENCREYLEEQLDLVRPKFIVCLGSTAATYLLGTKKPLAQLRGKFHEYKGAQVICTYHPAYLLPHRTPAKKKDVWEDMKMLLAKMGRPVPSGKDAGKDGGLSGPG